MNPRDIHSLDQIVLQQDALGFEVDTLKHYVIDGIYMKPFLMKRAGTFIGQHSHAYDHAHLVAAGEIRVFVDGQEAGDYGPAEIIEIKAGKMHVLMSLVNETVGVCIHNTHGAGEPEILEESEFAYG